MTDRLDELYKGGCSSAEFVAAAVPIESVFVKLQNKLPRGDPRRDLLANTFEAYQQLALAMKANDQGKGERPDATFAAAGIRKGLLTKILQGNMTPEEKNVYYAWRKALETNPRYQRRKRFVVRADEKLTAFLELEKVCAPTKFKLCG